MTRAYPLEWPQGKPRCEARKSANFKITLPKALAELQRELDLMGAALSVLSTNLETRLDGLPRGGQANPADPGAALYFEWDGQRVCMAIDRFDRVEHNIRAIGLSIAAIRGLERWGGDDLVRSAFTGFVALPPPIWITSLSPSCSPSFRASGHTLTDGSAACTLHGENAGAFICTGDRAPTRRPCNRRVDHRRTRRNPNGIISVVTTAMITRAEKRLATMGSG